MHDDVTQGICMRSEWFQFCDEGDRDLKPSEHVPYRSCLLAYADRMFTQRWRSSLPSQMSAQSRLTVSSAAMADLLHQIGMPSGNKIQTFNDGHEQCIRCAALALASCACMY